jgi:hypothetical protein
LCPIFGFQSSLHARKTFNASTTHIVRHVNYRGPDVGGETRGPPVNARHEGRVEDTGEHVVGVVRGKGDIVFGGRASLAGTGGERKKSLGNLQEAKVLVMLRP